MRTLFRGTTLLVVGMFVVSCSGLLKKSSNDAGVDDAAVAAEVVEASAPVPVAPALASNQGDVARFPDETAIAGEAATMQRSFNVREAPPAGAIVASLGKGTSVTKIASRDKFFLVTFDNPKAPGTKQMGWLQRDAFSAVIQDAGPLVCPVGEIALFGDSPFCGKLCSSDTDCPTRQACKGQANKLAANGKAGDGVTVCTAFQPRDAGVVPPAPPPLPVAVDAGAPVVIVDAGTAPAPSPVVAADVVPAVGGKCPGNFILAKKTGKCHRPCPLGPVGGECKFSKLCIKCDLVKVCGESQSQCR